MNNEQPSPATHSESSTVPMNEQQVELILSNIDRLPTLPAVAMRLMSISSVEDINLDEIILLIESDPAMSTMILSMCRTADKGLGDKITTVRRAVIMLGLEAVQVAALSVHVYQQLSGESAEHDSSDHLFDRSGFWIHSLAVACGAHAIAQEHPQLGVSPDQAYLAGLLHDLGKLSLDLILPKAYQRVLAMSQSRHCSLCLVERTMLGLDHHTAGKRMAEHWKLPDPIRDAIWLHSQHLGSLPESASRALVSIITIAESWARDTHLGWAGEYGEPLDLHEQAEFLRINPEFFKNNTPALIEGVATRGKILGLGEIAEQGLLIESLTAANRRLAQLNTDLRSKLSSAKTSDRILESIDAFHEHARADASPEQIFCSIVQSASVLVGSERAAVIVQHTDDAPWQTLMIDQGKVVTPSKAVQAPQSEHETVRPGMLAHANASQSMELATLDWLRELFMSVKEIGAPMLIGSADAQDEQSDDESSFLIIMPKMGSGIEQIVSTPGFATVRSLWGRALAQAIIAEKGRRVGEELAGANHAMTALRHELTTKESLVQLGKMAAGAAHEMNNPLAIIKGRSQQLFERAGTEREQDSARAITAASDQLTDLITSLHMIADPPTPKLALADPILMVRQAIAIARDRCQAQGHNVRIQLSPQGEIRPIGMDLDMLAKAIAEPIMNAVQASPDAIISVCIEPGSRDGRLLVRITDRGPGFTSDSIKHAFDPFFSELDAGRRSGLGLARARGLIELHKGEIVLGNNPGNKPGDAKGAQVVIYLETDLLENPYAADTAADIQAA